ncbi:MAG TPA: zinc-binding dehydrogenase [Roseiarcus sp.]|nr:zinc-binding dehydrogenase [Roseiarcus sp.]
MRAAVFRELGKPLQIETVAKPQAGPGEIVLKVHYCGVCGSDLHATHPGVFVVPDGTILGHEFAGEVVESGAPGWKVGDVATALPNNACEECRKLGLGECKDHLGIMCPRNTLTGFHPSAQGAYAEYVKFSAKEALRLPSAVKSREGASVEPLAVGLHAVNRGKVTVGERVLILGGGPIGLAVAVFAKLAGARDVVVSEFAPARREAAGALGATAAIDPSKEEVGEAFARKTGGPPDVIFECVGVPGMIQKAIDLSRTYGRIVVVGVCMVEDTTTPISAIFKEANIQYVLGYGRPDWRLVLDLLDSGRVDPRPMITDTVALDELPAAFEALRKPTTQIKVMVRPQE